jgi:hypothetical protein
MAGNNPKGRNGSNKARCLCPPDAPPWPDCCLSQKPELAKALESLDKATLKAAKAGIVGTQTVGVQTNGFVAKAPPPPEGSRASPPPHVELDKGASDNTAISEEVVKGESKRTKEVRKAQAFAAAHSIAAIRTLIGLMHNAKSENTRLAAAEAVLDRGIGKATIAQFIDNDLGEGSELTDDELDRLVNGDA